MGIAGILFLPVSGGLSLGLTIAGVGTGLAAGGMTAGSDFYKNKKHRLGILSSPGLGPGLVADLYPVSGYDSERIQT